MSTTGSAQVPAVRQPDGRRFTQRHPVAAFLLLAFGVGWPGLAIPVAAGLPTAPFLLLLVFVALLGSALLVTRLADGPVVARRLLARALIWRFGITRWAVVLLGVPVLTVAVAAASGTLRSPGRGWVVEIGSYLFTTLIFGALVLNVWEETAWAGFAQSRLMARHGLLVGSLLTAVCFAAIHLPLQLEGAQRPADVVVGAAVLFLIAPVYRYLLGMLLLDTGGSVLAAGVQHASWNAAQKLESVEAGATYWQVLVATTLLTACVAVGRRLRSSKAGIGREAEMAAATAWTRPPRTRPGVAA